LQFVNFWERAAMKRILIADDEETLLLAYKKLLNGPNVEIDTAQSVTEARQLIETKQYSAVIVDLRLDCTHKIDGLAIVSLTRMSFPESTIIVLTAYADSGTQNEVFKQGATYFLEKPVSALHLRELLQSSGIYSQAASSVQVL
jgi:two-component system response regulator PilR (NtrC family)